LTIIFDNDATTKLVLEWQQSGDQEVLDAIFQNTRALIEAIVSSYDSTCRADLIQVASVKLQYALKYFNPRIACLHTYFTTVIHNECKTYVRRHARQDGMLDNLEMFEECAGDLEPTLDDDSMLEDLMLRNRRRFPSFDTCVIDDITTYIYDALQGNLFSSTRKLIADLVLRYDLPKPVATIVYQSTLVYLRSLAMTKIVRSECKLDEFSIHQDLREIMGEDVYAKLSLLFSNITLKLN